MLDSNDQEFILFLIGCLCLSQANILIAFVVGVILIGIAFAPNKNKKKED